MALAHVPELTAPEQARTHVLLVPKWTERAIPAASTTFSDLAHPRATSSVASKPAPTAPPTLSAAPSVPTMSMAARVLHEPPVPTFVPRRDVLPPPRPTTVRPVAIRQPNPQMGVVLPFPTPSNHLVHDRYPLEFRRPWIGAATLAGGICLYLATTPSWLANASPDAASATERLLAGSFSLFGATGLTGLAAVASAGCLLAGARRRT